MNTIQFLLPLLLLVFLFFALPWVVPLKRERLFKIDWKKNAFLKDGDPFHYISGSMDYFRVPHEYWEDRMVKMRAAGFNVLSTYIEWRSHEPSMNTYNFEGMLNIVKYLQLAQKHSLLVIIKPGPYIGAERDMGGLPSWLLKNDSTIELRRNDPKYMAHVIRWFVHLFSLLTPYLYNNGGPIIMAQVENEYGSYDACDFAYMAYLRDLMRSLTRQKLILFTSDGKDDRHLRCGKIDQVLATMDLEFNDTDVESYLRMLRSHQSNGPLVVSKYYSGSLDLWGEPHNTVSPVMLASNLDRLLALDISVNIYMFHGGTSFDFGGDQGSIRPQPTSYDFDALLNEAGDITDKYLEIRKTISKYFPVKAIPEPFVQSKMELSSTAHRILNFDQILSRGQVFSSEHPMAFEELDVTTGFVVYSTIIDFKPIDPVNLTIFNLRDRAIVLVDNVRQGILSRMEETFQLPIQANSGSRLQIFVENHGRVSNGDMINERKGILGQVMVGSKVLKDWKHSYITNMSEFLAHSEMSYRDSTERVGNSTNLKELQSYPAIFEAVFTIEPDLSPKDSFLNLSNFTKGAVALNGHPLGRYWPSADPQVTLYVPGVWVKPYPSENILTIFEYEGTQVASDTSVEIQFQGKPTFR